MKSGKILVVLAIFLLVSIGFTSAQAYTAGLYEDVIAFGDSLSDSGNVIVAPLSNGPVWVEYLADHFKDKDKDKDKKLLFPSGRIAKAALCLGINCHSTYWVID